MRERRGVVTGQDKQAGEIAVGYPTASLVGLTIAADANAWATIGVPITDGGAQISTIRLRFDVGNAGIAHWTLLRHPDQYTVISSPVAPLIDGLITEWVSKTLPPLPSDPQIVGFDHLVIMTTSLERTCAAIASETGAPLKRIRHASAVRQGFHRLGEAIVEVVEPVEPVEVVVPVERVEPADVLEPVEGTGSVPPVGQPATFWGLVWVVDDLDAYCRRVGPELISAPRVAVQKGRRIASFRSAANLGCAVAVMSR